MINLLRDESFIKEYECARHKINGCKVTTTVAVTDKRIIKRTQGTGKMGRAVDDTQDLDIQGICGFSSSIKKVRSLFGIIMFMLFGGTAAISGLVMFINSIRFAIKWENFIVSHFFGALGIIAVGVLLIVVSVLLILRGKAQAIATFVIYYKHSFNAGFGFKNSGMPVQTGKGGSLPLPGTIGKASAAVSQWIISFAVALKGSNEHLKASDGMLKMIEELPLLVRDVQ